MNQGLSRCKVREGLVIEKCFEDADALMLPYGYCLDRLTFPSISDQFLAAKIPSKVLPRSKYRQRNNHVPRFISRSIASYPGQYSHWMQPSTKVSDAVVGEEWRRYHKVIAQNQQDTKRPNVLGVVITTFARVFIVAICYD